MVHGGVETIWELYTFIVMNSCPHTITSPYLLLCGDLYNHLYSAVLSNGEYTDLMYIDATMLPLQKGMLLWPKVCYFSCMSEQLKCGEMLLKANWYFLYIPWSTACIGYLPQTSMYTHTYIVIYLACIPCSGNFIAWFTEHLCLGNLHLLNICTLGLHLVNICAVDVWKVTLRCTLTHSRAFVSNMLLCN